MFKPGDRVAYGDAVSLKNIEEGFYIIIYPNSERTVARVSDIDTVTFFGTTAYAPNVSEKEVGAKFLYRLTI